MKKIILILIGIAIICLLFWPKTQSSVADYKTALYLIDGKQTAVTYFGNEVRHDLDDDGREDVAFIGTVSGGGSGTFYYALAALNTQDGWLASDGVLLGDRIAPQTTNIDENNGRKNVLIFNYADRKPSEPMTASPSVGKSIWLKLDPKTMQFGQVEQNFTGESDPAKMTLTMKTWKWISSVSSSNKFAITFKNDKSFSATTDCNGVGGEYSVNGNKIILTKMMSTLMFCEDSHEQEFSKMLSEVQTYMFTSKGELVFSLKSGGTMTFN